MPIAKEIQTYPMKETKAKNPSPSPLEEEPHQLLPTNEETWGLSGNTPTAQTPAEDNDDKKTDSSDEWENLSSIPRKEHIINKTSFHRCASTPEFSNLQDEDSYVLDCSTDTSVDAQSLSTVDDAVLLSHTKSSMRKVPSFKDIIMLNAQARETEDANQKNLLQKHHDKLRADALKKRKAARPKLVVNTIKRCTKSTGDLRSLVIHEDPEDDGFGGGGGGTIHEHEVLGDTDASEFYNRKNKGSISRHNGAKIRPDEAKRKEMIIHKKNAQRKAQEERALGEGKNKKETKRK
jgi:hypothetical protein